MTIVLTKENNKWVVTYTVPTIYSNKYVRLIFEAGIKEDFVYESNEQYVFHSNYSCVVDFTLTENNPYTSYDKIIMKPDNLTNTDPYILQGINNNGNITIQLGNNGTIVNNH